jgi:hypothetical protein
MFSQHTSLHGKISLQTQIWPPEHFAKHIWWARQILEDSWIGVKTVKYLFESRVLLKFEVNLKNKVDRVHAP